MKLCLHHLVLFAAITAVPATAFAYDEAVSGDLSTNPAAPTPLTFVVGSNQVKGTVRNTGLVDVRDFITFTIQPGQTLSAIRMLSYTNVSGGGVGNTGFHAINLGATSQNPDPSGGNANFYLGGDHAVSLPATENLLLDLADGTPAGTGFSVPLGPGAYSYLIQQISGATAYDLEFVVTGPAPAAVPAPTPGWAGALLAGLIALGGLVALRRMPARKPAQ